MNKLELSDIQRLVIYGIASRPKSAFFLCEIQDPDNAKNWLQARLREGAIPSAADREPDAPCEPCADSGQAKKPVQVFVAFTPLGLEALHLPPQALETFIPEFRQGMTHPARARAIGDGDSGNWMWGGRNTPAVHVLLAAYATDAPSLYHWLQLNLLDGSASGFNLVHRASTSLEETEPFGFRDGLSEPYVEGSGRDSARFAERDRIPAGEFILGYKNAFGVLPASPHIDPGGLAAATSLPPLPLSRALDLGRNGSFLVVRELEQHLAEFNNRSLLERARIVGRWPDGQPLVTHPECPGPRGQRLDEQALNAFTYLPTDEAGMRCPLGAHIRRANPRDALADESLDVSPEEAIRRSNQHRLLRRSRPFRRDDTVGLFFMCFNANIERQFEFVQQTWLSNPKFAGPHAETDPLLGPPPADASPRDHTVRSGPDRERMSGLPAFVTLLGGAYFFMPGLKALEYLTRLQSPARSAASRARRAGASS